MTDMTNMADMTDMTYMTDMTDTIGMADMTYMTDMNGMTDKIECSMECWRFWKAKPSSTSIPEKLEKCALEKSVSDNPPHLPPIPPTPPSPNDAVIL
jgi:hypothetical protein